jgi:hypothetical protein
MGSTCITSNRLICIVLGSHAGAGSTRRQSPTAALMPIYVQGYEQPAHIETRHEVDGAHKELYEQQASRGRGAHTGV